jgi:hypothetical protein
MSLIVATLLKISEIHGRLVGKLAEGRLNIDVEKVYPLREIGQALAHAAWPGRSGKILLSLGTERGPVGIASSKTTSQ